MNEKSFGDEPNFEENENQESKYPDKFEPIPEVVYGITLIGGVSPTGERYKQPRIFDKSGISKETGKKWYSHWVTALVQRLILTEEGTFEMPYKPEERTWFIDHSIIEDVKNYYNRKRYKFAFQKIARYNPDTGKSKNEYIVGTSIKKFIYFPDKNIYPKIEKEAIEKPKEPTEKEAEEKFEKVEREEIRYNEIIIDVLRDISVILTRMESSIDEVAECVKAMELSMQRMEMREKKGKFNEDEGDAPF